MKKLINLLPLLALMLVFQSCSDVLSRTEPTTSISQKKALNTLGGIQALRTGMFDYFHDISWSTTYMLCPEGKADDIFNRQGTNRLSGCTHNNKGATSLDWASSYNIINQANLLINAIPDGVISEAKEKQYKGEAYFIRAFVYHQMVRALGYEPGVQPSHGTGAGWDLGTVIRTQPTLSVKDAVYHPRSTAEQVYAFIETDLNKAINLLDGHSVGTAYYPSKAAAEAELARVYLYERKWGKANSMAENAITDAKSMGVEVVPSSGVANMFNESTGVNPGGIWVIKFTTLTTLGLNNSLAAYTSKGWMANMPTQDLINLYSKNDARLAWFSPCYDEYNGEQVTNCPATSPYIPAAHGTSGLELDKWIGDAGNFADDVPYLRMAEQLLIETEARLKGAPGDPLGPINELRTNRGLTKLSSVDMEDVLKARRREFVGEGMRFWDLKRLGKTIVKAPNSLGVSDVPYESFLNIAPIPSSDVVQSQQRAPKDSVLIQNPCYDGSDIQTC